MPVVIPSLNHIFEPLTPPLARKFAPVTIVLTLGGEAERFAPRIIIAGSLYLAGEALALNGSVPE